MNFEKKLKLQQYDQLWQEYCGFLDLSLTDYMHIQNRLMLEQITYWSESLLGKKLLNGSKPRTVEEFRQRLPLTTYDDYADILLLKQNSMLPAEPIIWIQTTWEGGKHPVKIAPYSKCMLDTYKNNVMSCFMLATSTKRGQYNIRPKDKMLYGLAPLPYATGLLPLLLNDEITLEYLPSISDADKMSFSERNKKGFELGLEKGIDLFFGLSSVAYFISKNLSTMSTQGNGKLRKVFKLKPKMAWQLSKAIYRSHKTGLPIKPKDIFKLKGFVCAGTDSHCYKDALEDYWGCRPLEISAGTEPTCVGTETWARNGMYFFPDACFYEFIPENEMKHNLQDPSYIPKTYLLDEVVENQNYELVVTVLKGGAFARYRVGDVYRCLGIDLEQSNLPRFTYLDRIPTVIDIAGFTRITEDSIAEVIKLSGLDIINWFAAKEYNNENKPFLHLYVELSQESLINKAVSLEILVEHLSVYFKCFDSDYRDLKKLLGIEPLIITILKEGTFIAYERWASKGINRINPSRHEVIELLKFQRRDYELDDYGCKGRDIL